MTRADDRRNTFSQLDTIYKMASTVSTRTALSSSHSASYSVSSILSLLQNFTLLVLLLVFCLHFPSPGLAISAKDTDAAINTLMDQQTLDYSVAAGEQKQFCTFFDNRAPKAQSNLKNCTWYKGNSCCRQVEIDASFSQMQPLIGASELCQRYTNYLMCYICDPYQYTFYIWRRLTVCEEFCNAFLDSCKDAILKGSKIRDIYSTGTEFCESRRYTVKARESGQCFYFESSFEETLMKSQNQQSNSATTVTVFTAGQLPWNTVLYITSFSYFAYVCKFLNILLQ